MFQLEMIVMDLVKFSHLTSKNSGFQKWNCLSKVIEWVSDKDGLLTKMEPESWFPDFWKKTFPSTLSCFPCPNQHVPTTKFICSEKFS